MVDFQAMSEAIYKGKMNDVKAMVQEAVDAGIAPGQILNQGLVAGMGKIGEDFKANRVYVPEVLIAARAMKSGMEILKPLLAESGVEMLATVVLGTVKGDLHDIGKNLVGMMLEGAGFKVVDLGVDIAPEKFIESLKEHNAHVLAMSALLTTTMVNMKPVIEALSSDPDLQGKVKTMVGGAPVTQEFAREIGAHGYAPDAASAVSTAKEILGIAA